MADPFLEDCGGWTPAPDVLTRNSNYGFEGAYLWGRIRRLCQIGKGSYTISHEELGKRIGMSRRTVIKYLDRLIEDGYTEDLTPGVRNKAHTYSVKKGEAKILAGMQISHTESDIPVETPNPDASESDVGMRNLHSDDAEIAHLDPSGMQNLHTEYAEIAQQGMQNLHLKRDSLDTSLRDIKDSSPNGEGPPPIPEIEPKLQQAIPEVQKSAKKSNKDKAPLSPAFRIFTEITEYFAVNTHWRNEAAWIVGEKPEDLEFWRRVVIGWTGKYPTKHNIQGMLDYYQRREIPGFEHKTYSQQVSESAHYEPPDPIPPPPKPEHVTVWEAVKPMVRDQMTRQTFDTLFKDAEPIARENGTFELRVKASALEMIEARPKVKANVLTAIQAVKPEIHDLDFTTWPVEAKELKL